MLIRETIADYSKTQTHKYTVWAVRRNLNVKPGTTWCYHSACYLLFSLSVPHNDKQQVCTVAGVCLRNIQEVFCLVSQCHAEI
jgi:hypothetical protein